MKNFEKFYTLSVEERLKIIKDFSKLSESDIELLKKEGPLEISRATLMSENVIGTCSLPFSVAVNFRINGNFYIIPMAIEETSVVAAASYGAKLCLPEGFYAEADEPIMIGLIQLVNVKNPEKVIERINERKSELESIGKESLKAMEKRGGGFKGISEIKKLDTSRGKMIVIYFEADVRDAMGANTINTMLEEIAPYVREIAGEGKIRLRILSNYAIKRKARAQAMWKKSVIGEDTIEGILDCYELAKEDIFRAVTHNKGIMNGIDAVALATGNDWRAIEAGAHGFAARNGRYMPLTQYEKDEEGNLIGKIELPLAVGTVGGSINSNPTAQLALKIANVKSAKELAMIMACVGLANNFAALRALGTEGIQRGHMELHARNLAIIAGAKGEEIEIIAKELEKEKKFKVEYAEELLKKYRKEKSGE